MDQNRSKTQDENNGKREEEKIAEIDLRIALAQKRRNTSMNEKSKRAAYSRKFDNRQYPGRKNTEFIHINK